MKNKDKGIYLDNAAATAVDPRVLTAMQAAAKIVGNPSSFNVAGRRAQKVLETARGQVAHFLNAHPSEIVFCASGSEANTLAIMGVMGQADAGHSRIITTPIEHLSVLQPVRALAKSGRQVVYLPVNQVGQISPAEVLKFVDKKTALVSVMSANNEIGTIQDVARIGRALVQWRRAHHSRYPLLHVDACQATAYLDLDVQRLCVDLLTLNGSKVYGPAGAAVLFVRRGVEVLPQILGGSQELGRRAGTENVPAVVGLAKALQLIRKSDALRVAILRDYFLARLTQVLPEARLNGPTGPDRLANNLNISIPDTDSENLLLELDRHGIWAGSGSACTAHAVEPSHVLRAIGTPQKYLAGALRFSLSKHTTKAELDCLLKVLPKVVARVRSRRA